MNCRVCQSPTDVLWREGAYSAERCAQCGLIGISGPATAELYDERYYVANYLSHGDLRVEHFRRLVRQAQVTLTEPLLDLGAGMGFFLQSLPPALRATAVAVEPARYARMYLQQEAVVPTVIATLSELPSTIRPFATVTLWDVLAHVNDPIDLLKTIHAHTRDDGQLIIKTPHHPAQLFRVAHLLRPLQKGRAVLHVPAQRWHFTPASLQVLLHKAGFSVSTTHWVKEAPIPYDSTSRKIKELTMWAFLKLSTRHESFLCIAGKRP